MGIDLNKEIHRLKAEYAAHGVRALEAMDRGDLFLLWSAKQLELDKVSKRANRDEGREVNAPLKLRLENDCRVIGEAVASRLEREEPGIER